ncbi:MAG: hypothetical protein Kow0037_32290 [Calditrichia bacterium]
MRNMQKFFAYLLAVLVLVNLFGCSKSSTEPEQTKAEIQTLIEYLEGAGGDYINTTAPKIVTASAVMQAGLGTYKILDIRAAADYNAGHIQGAINVTLAEIYNYVKANFSKTDKILVVCYTGQSAGHAVLALNLMGFDAYSLKFGMSSWHADFDKWTANCNSGFASHFTKDVTAKPAKGNYPTINTGKSTAEEILEARVQAMLSEGFKGINAADVLANPDNYFILNYFSEADYLGQGNCPLGHIKGAMQYTPKASLKSTADLATLPTDKKIVVYCWTGQNSSQVAAFLNVLGYDAVSLKFGVNGMIHDHLTGSKWDPNTAIAGYDYVTSGGK